MYSILPVVVQENRRYIEYLYPSFESKIQPNSQGKAGILKKKYLQSSNLNRKGLETSKVGLYKELSTP
jgi:hypothetical protein